MTGASNEIINTNFNPGFSSLQSVTNTENFRAFGHKRGPVPLSWRQQHVYGQSHAQYLIV